MAAHDEVGLLERRLHAEGFDLVAGVDEVGRGALAGPLVVSAVMLPPDYDLPGLRDSKLLTPLARGRMAAEIRRQALALTLVRVTPASIDRYGLHRCNLRALRRALARLRPAPQYALSDGYAPRRLPMPVLSVKKGDRVAASVAAASIVAKVARDRAMVRLHRAFPAYGFDRNKGYGTRSHWDALRAHGPSSVHRRSFYGVADGSLCAAPAETDEQVADHLAPGLSESDAPFDAPAAASFAPGASAPPHGL